MEDLPSRIEHTVLGPTTTWTEVQAVLDRALAYGMRACIPPCFVEAAEEYAPNVEVTSVVDFPHGQQTTETKCQEAQELWQAGAAELDVVANVGRLIGEEPQRLERELTEVVAAVPIPVKVIVQAPRLTPEQLDRIGAAVAEADAAFCKTATGFGDGGATVAAVERLAAYRPVKASGGIDSWTFAQRLIEAGADRIGSSAGDRIVEEYREAET